MSRWIGELNQPRPRWGQMSSEERRDAWRSACSMCMGTDSEGQCREGRCQAEERQRQEWRDDR